VGNGGQPPYGRGVNGCDASAGSFWAGAAVGLLLGTVLPRLLALLVDAWTRLSRRHGA
jgi:hypothetical protein